MRGFDETFLGPDARRRRALEELHDKRIEAEIKQNNIKLAKLDQAEAAILNGSQTPVIDPNTVLTVKRDLGELKGKVEPWTYDWVEKFVLCDMVLGEPTIKPENKVQAALEYVRANPSKFVHTDKEMVEGTARASEEGRKEGARVQKAVDDITLEQQKAELTSFDAKLKVLQEAKDAGLFIGWDSLLDMGFMDFLDWKAEGSPHARQTPSSSPTIQNHPWIGIALGGPGRIRNGGSTHTGFFMVPCTPPIKVDVQGLSGIQCVSTFQVRQTQKDAIEGTLNFFLTEFVNPGEYTTTINVTDSAGRTGSENYHLTVLEAAVPTLQPQPPLGTLTLISEGRRNKKRHSEPDPHGQKSE